MTLRHLSVEQFCVELASSRPTPGGGSVSALCGALSAALSEMATRLSMRRPNDETTHAALLRATDELDRLRHTLLLCVDADATSFDDVMAAIQLPKNTHDEQERRRDALESTLKRAASVPLDAARTAAQVFDWAGLLLEHGNPNATTDVIVSVLTARTAVLGATANVRVNLRSIRDADFVKETMTQVVTLETLADKRERELLALGYARLTA